MSAVALVALVGSLQGCVYLPRTMQVHDPDCRSVSKRMVLEGVQVASIAGCANEACIALVLGAGAVTAASVVVSGTIVVAGNIVYWVERQARCGSSTAGSITMATRGSR